MKAPRIAVVIANMKAERDLLGAVVGLTSDQIEQRISVLTQCIDRLEPPKGNFDSKYDTATKPRTRKPKPTDVSLGAIVSNDQSAEPSK